MALLVIQFLALYLISMNVEGNRGGPRLKFCDYISQLGLQNSHCPPQGMGSSVRMGALRDPEVISDTMPENNLMSEDNTPKRMGSSKGKDQMSEMPETTSNTPTEGYKSCFLKYNNNNCLKSEFCSSKLLCIDVVGNPCCVAVGVCPSKQQLDVKCVRSKPTNWCNLDGDCGRGSLCCDTGCGYNICVAQ